ncbi:MAG: MopE-related protein, partial [Candidatus Pacearchaeota archaeon]
CVTTQYCGDGIINGPETCDDGNTNNGDGCSSTCQHECIDSDGDRYGIGNTSLCLNTEIDCNDSNPAINPIATEICGNGIDENCNGNLDDICPITLPVLSVIEPINKSYINTLSIPLIYQALNASNCWYLLNNLKYSSLCNTNTSISVTENLSDRAYNITIVANNSIGQTQENRRFTLNYTRNIIINYSKFVNKGETTNLSNIPDILLYNISLILDDGINGKINFLQPVNLVQNNSNITDINSIVNISHNRIEVNSINLPSLNKPAKITLKNINFNNPRIMKDSLVCSECVIESYTSGILVFNVSGFSVYYSEETPISTGSGGGGGGNGGGGSSGSERTEFKTLIINHTTLNKTQSIQITEISRNDELLVYLNKNQYKLKITNITNQKINILNLNNQKEITILLGEEIKLNLDNDDLYELSFRYDYYSNNQGKILVRAISERVIYEEAKETDESEVIKINKIGESRKRKNILAILIVSIIISLISLILISMWFIWNIIKKRLI